MGTHGTRTFLSQWWGCGLFLLAVLWLSPGATAQTAQAEAGVEDKVKAAYLSKFGAYVDWPEEVFPAADAPLRIGVIEGGSLATELAVMVTGRSVNGRQIQVRRLRLGDPLTGLNVLFVGRQNNAQLPEIVAALKTQPTLIVTETPEGLASGAMINFVMVDGKLRFQVSSRAAAASRLTISARLLAAALKVEAPAP